LEASLAELARDFVMAQRFADHENAGFTVTRIGIS
jgi:hypothetical protein